MHFQKRVQMSRSPPNVPTWNHKPVALSPSGLQLGSDQCVKLSQDMLAQPDQNLERTLAGFKSLRWKQNAVRAIAETKNT